MPRPLKAIRPIEKRINLDEVTVARVELELFSELEGKVPYGAWSGYITRLIREDLDRRAGNSLNIGTSHDQAQAQVKVKATSNTSATAPAATGLGAANHNVAGSGSALSADEQQQLPAAVRHGGAESNQG